MATFEFSDGFDAVGWYMQNPRALYRDDDWYGDYDEED